MNTVSLSLPTNEELKLSSHSVSDSLLQTEISVPDMHCGACLSRIEKSLSSINGVADVRVNLTRKRVAVQWFDSADPRTFMRSLVEMGFHPVLPTQGAMQRDTIQSDYLKALAIAGFSAGNVMLLSVSNWAGADEQTMQLFHWLSALIAVPAVAYSGRFFFASAWQSIRSWQTNMDVPISIGIILACLMSIYDTYTKNSGVYFEAAIMLVFFLLISRTVDHMMRKKAAAAVDSLQALEPLGVQLRRKDGSLEFIPTDKLTIGDQIIVSAGERVPADSVVLSGISDINSEVIDGESMPKTVVAKTPVLAGSLNLSAELVLEVSATAADSFLASMQQLVRDGQDRQGAYRRFADRAAKWYAPFVHCAALIALFIWLMMTQDIHRSMSVAISVLIITCPCALALAVPMVQAIAAQRLFHLGIVMKDGEALEKMRLIDAIILDKTGTITDGLPVVTASSVYEDESLRLAGLMTAGSEHPYAKSIRNLSTIKRFDSADHELLQHVKEIPGCGIEARLHGSLLRLGKRDWASQKAPLATDYSAQVSETVLYKDDHMMAEFYFENKLRKDARSAVDQMQLQVSEVIVASGDTASQVELIINNLALDASFSHCLPEAKLKKAESYTKSGTPVLMVGDGLNDAAAMAGATVSMAPGKAATASRSLADFVFLKQSLLAVPQTVDLARKAHQLVKQNIMIAVGYNLIALPIAFAGYVTPLVAALAMSTSSLLVVGNALRISRYTPLKNRADQEPGT